MSNLTVGRIEFGPPAKSPTASDGLEASMRLALARFDALSPIDKAIHREEQRRSMVRGLSGGDLGPNPLVEEIKRLRALVVSLGGDTHA